MNILDDIDDALLEKMLGTLLTRFFDDDDTFSALMDHYSYLQLCFLLTDALKTHGHVNDLELNEPLQVTFIKVDLLEDHHTYQMRISITTPLTSLALVYAAAMMMSVFVEDYYDLHLKIMLHYARLLEASVRKEDEDHETFDA